jgi:hypothetical protein
MGTELPTKVMLGQTLVLMQMTFLNNVRKAGRLVLSPELHVLIFPNKLWDFQLYFGNNYSTFTKARNCLFLSNKIFNNHSIFNRLSRYNVSIYHSNNNLLLKHYTHFFKFLTHLEMAITAETCGVNYALY